MVIVIDYGSELDDIVLEVLVKAAFSNPPANNDYEHHVYKYEDVKQALTSVLNRYAREDEDAN